MRHLSHVSHVPRRTRRQRTRPWLLGLTQGLALAITFSGPVTAEESESPAATLSAQCLRHGEYDFAWTAVLPHDATSEIVLIGHGGGVQSRIITDPVFEVRGPWVELAITSAGADGGSASVHVRCRQSDGSAVPDLPIGVIAASPAPAATTLCEEEPQGDAVAEV